MTKSVEGLDKCYDANHVDKQMEQLRPQKRTLLVGIAHGYKGTYYWLNPATPFVAMWANIRYVLKNRLQGRCLGWCPLISSFPTTERENLTLLSTLLLDMCRDNVGKSGYSRFRGESTRHLYPRRSSMSFSRTRRTSQTLPNTALSQQYSSISSNFSLQNWSASWFCSRGIQT